MSLMTLDPHDDVTTVMRTYDWVLEILVCHCETKYSSNIKLDVLMFDT